MKQKVKSMQFVEISMHEIFAFQDKLDAVKDNPEKVWQVVDDFFWEAEMQLELDPNFIQEIHDLDLEADFIHIDDIEQLFKQLEDDNTPSHISLLKEYKKYLKNKSD